MKKPIDFEKWDKKLKVLCPDIVSRIIAFVSFLVCAFAYQFNWDNLGAVVCPILCFEIGYFIGYVIDLIVFCICKYVHDKKNKKEVNKDEKEHR